MKMNHLTDQSVALPAWMRGALWTTAVLNVFGAVAFFVPALPLGRSLMGLPAVHPLYLRTIAEFIFFVGLAYGYCAWANRAPRFFIAMGAAGKLVFFIILVGCWRAGDLPLQTPLLGSADFVFGSLFIAWLIQGYRS